MEYWKQLNYENKAIRIDFYLNDLLIDFLFACILKEEIKKVSKKERAIIKLRTEVVALKTYFFRDQRFIDLFGWN